MSDGMVDLALRTASVPVVGLDLGRHLSATCDAVVRTLQVPAAVVVVLDPAGAYGSDVSATLIGETQQGAAVGPVAHALRSGRPMLTPDLLRVGPPTLAAAAADCGLVSSASYRCRPWSGRSECCRSSVPGLYRSTQLISSDSSRYSECSLRSWRTSLPLADGRHPPGGLPRPSLPSRTIRRRPGWWRCRFRVLRPREFGAAPAPPRDATISGSRPVDRGVV
jgi:hypothetical protein